MANVSIIGGGVTGLFSAYYLEAAGYDVTVFDRGDITDGCSFGNMGYMSPSHFVPLASPGIIAEGLRHMISSSSPFYIKPRFSLPLLKWAWHFYKNSTASTVSRHAPHLDKILQLSRSLMNDVKANIGDDFSMQDIGCLMMCRSQKSLDHEFHLADQAGSFGLKVERLDKNAVQALEPMVELDVRGAVLFKDDCHFHPGRMMRSLKNYLVSKNVIFKLNNTITGFDHSGGKIQSVICGNERYSCDDLVISTGAWLPQTAALLDIPLLVEAGKGYSYTYPSVTNNLNYPAILVDGRCAVTPWGNELRIGGTMELSGINNKVIPERMEGIYHSVKKFYPGLAITPPPVQSVWTGLRPVTPDGLPYIGRAENYDNLVIAGAHAMLGISEGPGTGLIVSELLQRKETTLPINAFRLNRF